MTTITTAPAAGASTLRPTRAGAGTADSTTGREDAGDFPMLLEEVQVASVERVSPSLLRLVLASRALAGFGVDGPLLDQRVKLVLPGPAGLPPITRGPSWYQDWCALPDDVRGHVRTYTVRAVHGTGADTQVVVDVVLHPGECGPGSRWAASAEVGDRVLLLGPRRGFPFGGIEFDPAGASRVLLAGDETAVPAVAGILAGLPIDAAGTAYLEVPEDADVQDLAPPSGVRVVWLPRNGRPHGERLCLAVLTLFGLDGSCREPLPDLPADGSDSDLWETPAYSSSGEELGSEPLGRPDLYAWVAGEAGVVARIRRHLVKDAGLDRRQVAFMGYWRQGVAMRS